MLKYFDEACGERKVDYEPGDILVFWINERNRRPQHIALKSDYGMIHTYQDIGRVVEHVMDFRWIERFICAYRFPGLED